MPPSATPASASAERERDPDADPEVDTSEEVNPGGRRGLGRANMRAVQSSEAVAAYSSSGERERSLIPERCTRREVWCASEDDEDEDADEDADAGVGAEAEDGLVGERVEKTLT